MVGLGQPVLDAVPLAGAVEGVDAPEAGLAAGGPEGADGGLGLGVVVDRQGVSVNRVPLSVSTVCTL